MYIRVSLSIVNRDVNVQQHPQENEKCQTTLHRGGPPKNECEIAKTNPPVNKRTLEFQNSFLTTVDDLYFAPDERALGYKTLLVCKVFQRCTRSLDLLLRKMMEEEIASSIHCGRSAIR